MYQPAYNTLVRMCDLTIKKELSTDNYANSLPQTNHNDWQ